MSDVDRYINSFDDWRNDKLTEVRHLIEESAPSLKEGFKWGVPVWELNGLICAISGFKDHVKINFFKGAFLDDPNNLFNSGLDSKEHRSINLAKDDKLDKTAIKTLISSAIAYNK